MKKLYFILVCLLSVHFTGVAQNAATPNPGFENWTQVGNRWDPDNWNTLNPTTAPIGILTCTRASGADVHSGTYAIKLTTKLVFTVVANGIASTATLVTTPPYGVSGGIPFTQRPDSIVGWYKYTPASAADSGFVQFVLLDAANDTVGFVRFSTPNTTVGTYTRFSKPVTYFSAATPALSYWILSSSDGTNPVVNSALWVDDLNLVFNPSGINETNTATPLQIGSNLVDEELEIENRTGKNASLVLFDSAGKLVVKKEIQPGIELLNLRQIKSGIYFYRFLQAGDEKPVYGKLIKL